MKKIVTVVALTSFLAACATGSKDIAAGYTSPLQYKDYSCEQLTAEMTRVSTRVSQIGGRLDEAASHDKAIAGVGIVLFWPALFALGGTKQQEADYARLRGEYDAINQAAIQTNCKLAIEQRPAITSSVVSTEAKK